MTTADEIEAELVSGAELDVETASELQEVELGAGGGLLGPTVEVGLAGHLHHRASV